MVKRIVSRDRVWRTVTKSLNHNQGPVLSAGIRAWLVRTIINCYRWIFPRLPRPIRACLSQTRNIYTYIYCIYIPVPLELCDNNARNVKIWESNRPGCPTRRQFNWFETVRTYRHLRDRSLCVCVCVCVWTLATLTSQCQQCLSQAGVRVVSRYLQNPLGVHRVLTIQQRNVSDRKINLGYTPPRRLMFNV